MKNKLITARGQRGLGLVETLVAVAILGTSVAASVAGLATGSLAVGTQDEAVMSQSLARSQLEYTKSLPYDAAATTYPAVAAPAGYGLAVGVSGLPGADENIQVVTVTVSHGGSEIMTVSDYKVNR